MLGWFDFGLELLGWRKMIGRVRGNGGTTLPMVSSLLIGLTVLVFWDKIRL